MAFDSPRIAELRRRVQADPSSIAFAQLAEEYRRSGNYDEAVLVCRAGLEHHPGYLSARVTLGRAMMETGDLDEAERQFDLVLTAAPDNLAAIRGIAEINQRRGDLPIALEYYQKALSLARHDPDLEETVAQIGRALADAAGEPSPGLSFEQARSELLSAADRMPPTESELRQAREVVSPERPSPARLFDFDGLLEALGQPPTTPAPPHVEAWLSGAAPVPAADESTSSPVDAGPRAATTAPASRERSETSDVLGRLEQELRRYEAESSPDGAVPAEPGGAVQAELPAPPVLSAAEQAALDELERWLAVLEEARRRASPAA